VRKQTPQNRENFTFSAIIRVANKQIYPLPFLHGGEGQVRNLIAPPNFPHAAKSPILGFWFLVTRINKDHLNFLFLFLFFLQYC
jgi:hypothetical protein